MTSWDESRLGDLSDRSIGELVRELSELVSRLVRDELALARAELTQKARRAGIGTGLIGGAGLLGVYAIATLVAALVLGLAELMPAWLAALAAAALLLVIAAGMGWAGARKLGQATPPIPEQALAGVKADLEEIKTRVRQ